MANPLRMRCELNSTNVEEKKFFHDKKQVKSKKKTLFRRLIKLITSDEDINFWESFKSSSKQTARTLSKNQNRKKND